MLLDTIKMLNNTYKLHTKITKDIFLINARSNVHTEIYYFYKSNILKL